MVELVLCQLWNREPNSPTAEVRLAIAVARGSSRSAGVESQQLGGHEGTDGMRTIGLGSLDRDVSSAKIPAARAAPYVGESRHG
jgi:hypothetical protein